MQSEGIKTCICSKDEDEEGGKTINIFRKINHVYSYSFD
jgi:hypothetical protein